MVLIAAKLKRAAYSPAKSVCTVDRDTLLWNPFGCGLCKRQQGKRATGSVRSPRFAPLAFVAFISRFD